MSDADSRIHRLAGLVEATAVSLFFYQALRVLFSVLFGLIYDALFEESLSMATVGLVLAGLVLALLTPLAGARQPRGRRIALLVAGLVVFVARWPLTFNEPGLRLVASLAIVAGTGLYLVTRLRFRPGGMVEGLILGLVVDQVLRIAGHTFDVTLRPEWWPGQLAVSLVLCLLALWLYGQRARQIGTMVARPGLSVGLVWGGWLFLESSLLAFPNAMARWSGQGYLALALASPILLLLVWLGVGLWRMRWPWLGGTLVLLALCVGLSLGYVLEGVPVVVGLLLAQLAAMVALVSAFSAQSRQGRDSLGLALSLGNLLYLLLSFAYAFTFTYAYTLDLFRGMALPVFVIAGLMTCMPLLILPAVKDRLAWPPVARWLVALGGSLVLAAIVLVVEGGAWQPKQAVTGSLRAATYNMHYGYDGEWHLSLEAQAQAIERSGADLVMLQEVDTARPTSYMIDDAMWLAQRLEMKEIYLPTMEHLTGIALLSRYPVRYTETLLLPSELEQTGIIWAEVDVGGKPVNACATWLGLEPEERARQLDTALILVTVHPGPALFGGDLNSTPDSPVYERIAAAGFIDPFVALGLDSPPTSPAVNPEERIDFVWMRSLVPTKAEVLDATASDHRLVVVEAALP
ncbi:MAG: endonuclease/exonuclease/phosphatase family protein [Anaerolineae bacterium]|nr:endonuclease/exonuclease/phosphatase family protein [Anaerolineae bacterium]